jgi:quercetin dioxygenase-like cupin family protein
MKISRVVAIPFLSMVLVGAGAARGLAQEHHHVVVPVDKVQWNPAPPILPPGAQLAVLEGNPGAKGPIVMRLTFPANYVVPPHWHSMHERITVISGTFNIGNGDVVDRKASQPLAAGGFLSLPAKMHHYAWVSEPTVVQINLEGPFDLFYVNPSDDPQKKAPASSTK